jgi:hypothetical protein
VGPADQRFGAFARRYDPGRLARVRVAPEFLASLSGEVSVRIVALNEAPAVLRVGGKRYELPASPGRWCTTEIAVPAADLANAADAEIELGPGAAPLTLHLVEVRRR